MRSSYKLNNFMLAIILLLAGFIAACEGPQGPAGKDGKDGSNGTNGDPGTAVCGTCHNQTTALVAKSNQYALSLHAQGDAFVYANRTACAPCHNTEGYLESLTTGADTVVAAFPNPSTINCRTCHKIHQSYDANDWKFTNVAPFTFRLFGHTKQVDLKNANLCAKCHQARELEPPINEALDSIKITSSRWGPHHGPQSTVLVGFGGYSLDGSTIPSQQAHQNIATGPCFTCHMAGPQGHMVGGHSFMTAHVEEGVKTINTSGCIGSGCHSTIDANWNPDGSTKVTDMTNDLYAVRAAIAAKGWIDTTGGNPANDLWKASTKKPLTISKMDAKMVQNYLLLATDHSTGIHNPKFASALLRQCKTYLGI